mgnify:CR=1 FL=1
MLRIGEPPRLWLRQRRPPKVRPCNVWASLGPMASEGGLEFPTEFVGRHLLNPFTGH